MDACIPAKWGQLRAQTIVRDQCEDKRYVITNGFGWVSLVRPPSHNPVHMFEARSGFDAARWEVIAQPVQYPCIANNASE